jgi:hypothetical protein
MKQEIVEINTLWREAVTHHQAGRVDEAANLYRRILSIEGRHHAAMNYLGAALAVSGEPDEALRCFAESVRICPEAARYWSNYGTMLEELGRLDEAADCYERAGAAIKLAKIENRRKRYDRTIGLLTPTLAEQPDNIDVLDTLVVANHHLGNALETTRLARHSLVIRDRTATRTAIELRIGNLPPLPSAETRARNVIAYSLWGTAPRYVAGMIQNIGRAARHLPDWQIRVYCATDVPRDAVEVMTAAGAVVMDRPAPQPATIGLFWRFEPIEEDLDRVLMRDADCRIGAKEAAAVNEWITSGKPFHIMHDHPCNNELILAGLWGAVCGTLDGFSQATMAYKIPTLTRWTDQLFLRNEVWPVVKNHALIHDSVHDLFGARPFPAYLRVSDDPPFVGASYL